MKGWNARYDEWIKRSRIAAKLSGKEKLKKYGNQAQGESEEEDQDQAKKRIEAPPKSLKKLGKTNEKVPASATKVGRPRLASIIGC